MTRSQESVQTSARVAGSVEKQDQSTEDLIIDICPYDCDFYQFTGSRAQLEVEFVIPEHIDWPAGREWSRWDDDGFTFSLMRARPHNRSVLTDRWVIRCEEKDGVDYCARMVTRKEKELAKAIYLNSPDGRNATILENQRYWQAKEDQTFQVFKSNFLPQRKKPGRKPKDANLAGPEGAAKSSVNKPTQTEGS